MENKKTIPNNLFFASVEELIGEGRSVEMTVKGYSMRPFVRNGRETVVLSPLPDGGVKEGMVILFRYGGQHILHRLVRIEGERLTMEGDGNYRTSEVVAPADVVAYVSEVGLMCGRRIGYNSCAWRWRSAVSLARKWARRVAVDLKHKICK